MVIDVLKDFTGGDRARVLAAFAKAARNPGSLIDFRGKRTWDVGPGFDVHPAPGFDRLCFDMQGSGNLTFVSSGQIRLLNWKGSRMAGCGMRGPGYVFQSDNSAGMNTVERCTIEGGGFTWDDFGSGKDISNWDVVLCAGWFKVIGSNALGPWSFRLCSAVDQDIAFDLGHGGSSVSLHDCGATRCRRFLKTAGGWSIDVYGGRTEDCDWSFEFGGNDMDGEGQGTTINVFGGHDDKLKSGFAKLHKAGVVAFHGRDVLRGASLIEAKNENLVTPLRVVSTLEYPVRNIGAGKAFVNGLEAGRVA